MWNKFCVQNTDCEMEWNDSLIAGLFCMYVCLEIYGRISEKQFHIYNWMLCDVTLVGCHAHIYIFTLYFNSSTHWKLRTFQSVNCVKARKKNIHFVSRCRHHKKCSVYFSSLSLVRSHLLAILPEFSFSLEVIDEAMNHIARFMCLMSTQRTRRILTFKTVN